MYKYICVRDDGVINGYFCLPYEVESFMKIGECETEESLTISRVDGLNVVLLYKWDGKTIVPRTEAELAADELPAPVPSNAERLAAVEAAVLDLVLGGELGG